MAVAFDAFTGQAGFDINPSFSHTPVGTPRGVLILLQHSHDDTPTVTYGGTNVPQRARINSAAFGALTVYTLGASIPTGAQTVAVLADDTSGSLAWVYTVTAATNTEYVASATIDQPSGANPSTTLALSSRTSFVAEAFMSFDKAVDTDTTPFANWTSRSENLEAGFVIGSYSYNTIASTNVTVGWTQTSGQVTALAAAISEVVSANLTVSLTETIHITESLSPYIPGLPLTRNVTSETIRISQTVAASGLAAANARYVDDSLGIDAPGRGTSVSDPWLTLSYAVSQLSPGDTLYIRGGTYTGTANTINSSLVDVPSGTAGDPIVIRPYPGETVTIQPPHSYRAINLRSNAGDPDRTGIHYLEFYGGDDPTAPALIIDGINTDYGSMAEPPTISCIYVSDQSSHLRFVNLEVKNGWSSCYEFTNGPFPYEYLSTLKEIVGGSIHGYGRALWGSFNNSGYGAYISSGAIVDGVDISDGNGYGLHITDDTDVPPDGDGHACDDTVVKNCYIHDLGEQDSDTEGVNYSQSAGITIGHGTGLQVYNNTIANIIGGGIVVYSYADGALVANNTITGCTGGFGGDMPAVRLQYTVNNPTHVINNILWSNAIDGVEDLEGSATTAGTIHHNLTSNPVFVDPDNEDFRLDEFSGARDAGTTVSEVATDYLGTSRPQNGIYDIGAHEYPTDIVIPPVSGLAFDAATRLGYSINPSGTHTPVGTPRGVLIIIFHDTTDTPTVTYGGTNVPQRRTFDSTVLVGDSYTVYTLGESIPTGAQTVAVANAPTSGQSVWIYTVTALTDTEYVASVSVDPGSVANPAGNLVLAGRVSFVAEGLLAVQANVGNVSPLTNWTSRSEQATAGVVFASYSYNIVDSATVAVGWTQTTALTHGLAAAIAEVTDSYQTTVTDALRITDAVTAILASALTVLSVSKTETLHVGDAVSPTIGTGLDPSLPISETTEARSGLARSGTTWSNYFTPHVMMSIGSVDLSNDIIVSSLQVSLALNEEQDTARFTLRPSAAVAANPVTVLDEVLIGWDSSMSARLFAGQVARVALRRRPGNQGDPFTEVECVDWSRLFNRILITRTWTNTSVTQIVYDIVNDHVGLDFSTTGVQTGLPGVVSFSAANERAGQLLTRLVAVCGGGGHYITAQKVLRFFGPSGDTTATAPPNPGAITDADGLTQEFSHRTDISQQRTRVYSEGRTQSVMVNVPAGETTIPVSFGWGFPTGVTSTAYVRFSGSVSHVAQYWTASHLLGPPGAYVAVEANPGDTTVTVSTSLTGTQWAETSWAHTETNTFFSYTLAAGVTLTGIPASGHGSIQEPIPVGAAIYAQDQIRMMEPLTVSLLADDSATVQIFEQNDAEVTATAAAEDSDGVHEYLISNADVTSGYGEQLIPLAQADLAAYSSHGGIITCDWVTTDRNAVPGTQQVVNLTGAYALSTTVTITNVELSWIRQDLAPTRRCVGSDVKRPGFVDLLSDIITERNAIYR